MALYAIDKDGNRIKVAGAGTPGKDGTGVPDGGMAGQVLTKRTAANQDAQWDTLTAEDVGALPITGGTLTGNLVISPAASARAGGVTTDDPPTINFGPTTNDTYVRQLADGQLEIKAPDIYFVVNPAKPKTVGVTKLVTSSTVTAIQGLTQAEFDALTAKDPNTLYVVPEES